MEHEWELLFTAWCVEHELDDLDVERVQQHENYGLAHAEWTEGADDDDVHRLLDQAAVGMGMME